MNDTGNGKQVKPWQWTSETAPSQGGMPGRRNRFGLAFIQAVQEQFNEGGMEALRILRIENPEAFLKVCASVIPHEVHLIPMERSVVRWMRDDDDDVSAITVVQKYE